MPADMDVVDYWKKKSYSGLIYMKNGFKMNLDILPFREAPSESLLLTAEGGWRQFALVHAVDGAEGAHGAAYTKAVEHLSCLDQRFANRTACKFTVCLGRGRKISTAQQQHQNHDQYQVQSDRVKTQALS